MTTDTNKQIRLLIVDDHPMMLEGLCGYLSKQPHIEIVGTGGSGIEAVELAQRLMPDVILMDISMPKLNGMDAAAKIMSENPDARILFNSVNDDAEYVRQFLKTGARGFITKRSDPLEVLRAIEVIAGGGAYFSPEISALVLEIASREKSESQSSATHQLTEREREILTLIADGHTNRHIAEMFFTSVRTIETHRRNIMQKLGLHKLVDLFDYAVEHGYRKRKK